MLKRLNYILCFLVDWDTDRRVRDSSRESWWAIDHHLWILREHRLQVRRLRFADGVNSSTRRRSSNPYQSPSRHPAVADTRERVVRHHQSGSIHRGIQNQQRDRKGRLHANCWPTWKGKQNLVTKYTYTYISVVWWSGRVNNSNIYYWFSLFLYFLLLLLILLWKLLDGRVLHNPSKHTTSFWRWRVFDVQTTLKQRRVRTGMEHGSLLGTLFGVADNFHGTIKFLWHNSTVNKSSNGTWSLE